MWYLTIHYEMLHESFVLRFGMKLNARILFFETIMSLVEKQKTAWFVIQFCLPELVKKFSCDIALLLKER